MRTNQWYNYIYIHIHVSTFDLEIPQSYPRHREGETKKTDNSFFLTKMIAKLYRSDTENQPQNEDPRVNNNRRYPTFLFKQDILHASGCPDHTRHLYYLLVPNKKNAMLKSRKRHRLDDKTRNNADPFY